MCFKKILELTFLSEIRKSEVSPKFYEQKTSGYSGKVDHCVMVSEKIWRDEIIDLLVSLYIILHIVATHCLFLH